MSPKYKYLTVVAVVAAACMFQSPARALPPVSASMPTPVPVLTSSGRTLASTDAKAEPMSPAAATDMLLTLAYSLRDIRYRFGGHAPSTGFDCSGFVLYVFRHALGVHLPRNSRRQFASGSRVARDALQPGDLVFFHTQGQRVSHVGIYLDDGRFIHAPSAGETVRVDSLHANYWAHHYAGARRMDAADAQS